jgi:hypothetical protein
VPDRLLFAGLDVRQGIFLERRERQEFPPRNRSIRAAQQLLQFRDGET